MADGWRQALWRALRGAPDRRMTALEEQWSDPEYWDRKYELIGSAGEGTGPSQYVARDSAYLMAALRRLAPWSLTRVLVAGCGISRTPFLLRHCGYDVTAIDVSPYAIALAARQDPNEDSLAECISVHDVVDDFPDHIVVCDDRVLCLAVVRALRAPGGALRFLVADWRRHSGAFDAVVCQYPLRGAGAVLVRESLAAFYRQLAPGGVLLLEDRYSSWSMGEGARCGLGMYGAGLSLVEAAGFTVLDWPGPRLPPTPTVMIREANRRYAMCRWTSG